MQLEKSDWAQKALEHNQIEQKAHFDESENAKKLLLHN